MPLLLKMFSGLVFMYIQPAAGAFFDEDFMAIDKCRKGDVESFGILVERYQKKMLNIALSITGDYEDACDAVQEAFISAYKALDQFKGDSKFLTWLTAIVVNKSRNRLAKHAAIKKYFAGSIDDTVETENGTIGYEHASSEDSPQKKLEQRELDKKVRKCIFMMETELSEVLVLREIQGFSYEEISGMLKIPDGTVKSRLFRARRVLKDNLMVAFGDAW